MSTTTRRAPLASIPNAVNSPHRTVVTSTAKRPRAQANLSQQENEPFQKRQMLEKGTSVTPTTPRRQIPLSLTDGRVFDNGNVDGDGNTFRRKLAAAGRERASNVRSPKNTSATGRRDVENIRQWQRHYRKIFPGFHFYFDGIPDDVRVKFMKHVAGLGAHDEKFFSKSVTHIITNRAIPSELDSHTSSESTSAWEKIANVDQQAQTINPSLLDKTLAQSTTAVRGNALGQMAVAAKRDGANSTDILTRGRQMGMKIWAVEKLQRILVSILEDGSSGHNTRSINASLHSARPRQEDLSQVLRNEKLGSAAEKDHLSWARDMLPFKGPFIFVHDMEEKFRPTMLREYPKVAIKEEGEWPQFRSAAIGKCPFVEDVSSKKEIDHERSQREKMQKIIAEYKQKAQQPVPRTRSVMTQDAPRMEPPRRTSPRKALREGRNGSAGTVWVDSNAVNQPPGSPHQERQPSFPPKVDCSTVEFARPTPMQLGGEPAASGIQRSNLTSAIRSQMISSTAGSAGAKAVTSREVHELKRKVLERSHTGSLSIGSIPSSHRMNDLAGALKNAREPAPQRAAKSKAQEKLGGIQEEAHTHEEDRTAQRATHGAAKKKKQPAQRDPKPGFCENCRDKYEDFEEHIGSRKHRKFALTQSNWTDLDELLKKLQQP